MENYEKISSLMRSYNMKSKKSAKKRLVVGEKIDDFKKYRKQVLDEFIKNYSYLDPAAKRKYLNKIKEISSKVKFYTDFKFKASSSARLLTKRYLNEVYDEFECYFEKCLDEYPDSTSQIINTMNRYFTTLNQTTLDISTNEGDIQPHITQEIAKKSTSNQNINNLNSISTSQIPVIEDTCKQESIEKDKNDDIIFLTNTIINNTNNVKDQHISNKNQTKKKSISTPKTLFNKSQKFKDSLNVKTDLNNTNSSIITSIIEQKYCICKEISYGDMIECDNPKCEIGWFHYGCVNVTKKPVGIWFCPCCKDKF